VNTVLTNGELEAMAAANGPLIVAVTVFLIVWFTIMAVTGWLAARRNREGGLWAAFAFFGGPLALIALLLLPRREHKPSLSPLWAQLEVEHDLAAKHDQPRPNLGEGGGTL
jgi:hypothetical protein